MLTPTEAIAIVPAISSAQEISSAPASSSTPAGLSAQRPPSLRESPDPSSRTLEPTQHDSHGFPWQYPNVRTHVYPERAGIPRLERSCHSSLGSSGDISISHSGVSCGHWNVPQTSKRHTTTSPDSSGLHRLPSRTLRR